MKPANVIIYLESKATEIAKQKYKKCELFRSTIEIFDDNIDKLILFAEENEINDEHYRLSLIIWENKVIATFDYKLK